MARFLGPTSEEISDMHIMMHNNEHGDAFDPGHLAKAQAFFIPTVGPRLFLGSSSAQLGIPSPNDAQPTQQSNGSHPASQTSSVLGVTGENRIRRKDLLPRDKNNIDRACDLMILDIIGNIGWDSTPDQLVATGKECLSQACADTEHDTEWDSNIQRLFVEHIRSFRSKMAKKAEDFAKRYELPNIVDPGNLLQPTDRRTRAIARCEQMLVDTNWQIYYLHHYDTATGHCTLFGNQIFQDYHLTLWYKSSMSPFHGNQQTLQAWGSTPLRLLSTSAAALACGLRRVAQAVGLSTRPARTVRYGLQEYNQIEEQITMGMQSLLGHQNNFLRNGFAALLSELHVRGCRTVDGAATLGFYIPPLQQLQGAAQNNILASTDSSSEHEMLASN